MIDVFEEVFDGVFGEVFEFDNSEPPTSGSLEWTLPESRLHWNAKGTPIHYTLPESRLHWNVQ